HAPAPHLIYTLSLHDALPIYALEVGQVLDRPLEPAEGLRPGRQDREPLNVQLELFLEEVLSELEAAAVLHPPQGIDHDFFQKERSEEHTSELQSRFDLVCRLL